MGKQDKNEVKGKTLKDKMQDTIKILNKQKEEAETNFLKCVGAIDVLNQILHSEESNE